MGLPLRDLMRILAIAESGSVSEAARRLHVAQPALSKTVSSVEDQLGIRLFEREHSGMHATPAAVDILARARTIRGELRRIEQEVEARRHEARRRLVIGVVAIHPLDQFSRSVLGMMKQHPEVGVRIQVGGFEELVNQLADGSIDFLVSPLPYEPLGPGFLEQMVYWEELVVACGRLNPLFESQAPTAQQICSAPWTAGPPGSESHARLAELCRNVGLPMPNIALEIDMVPARRSAVQHSGLLSIFQRAQVTLPVVASDIRPLAFEWPHTLRAIGTIRSSASPANAHDAFVASFEAALLADGLSLPRPAQPQPPRAC